MVRVSQDQSGSEKVGVGSLGMDDFVERPSADAGVRRRGGGKRGDKSRQFVFKLTLACVCVRLHSHPSQRQMLILKDATSHF